MFCLRVVFSLLNTTTTFKVRLQASADCAVQKAAGFGLS